MNPRIETLLETESMAIFRIWVVPTTDDDSAEQVNQLLSLNFFQMNCLTLEQHISPPNIFNGMKRFSF